MKKKRVSRANQQVRRDMHNALLKLIEEKNFSNITVSDITSMANVSRMSFYRNYHSIEEILIEHLNEIVKMYEAEDETQTDLASATYFDKVYLVHCFEFFYKQHDFIDTLISCGMGDLFLGKITEYLINKWADRENSSREEVLKISAYAGSIYNMYREWNTGNFKEKPSEIAEILYKLRK